MIINISKIFHIISGISIAMILYQIVKKDVIVIETNIDEKCKK